MSQSKIDRQLELEQESIELGAQRYRADRPLPWRDSASKKEETEMPPGKRLLQQCLEPTATAIEDFVAAAYAGKAGRKHSAVKYLANIDPIQAAYIAVRVMVSCAAKCDRLQHVAINIARHVENHIDITVLQEHAPGLAYLVGEQTKQNTSAYRRARIYRHAMSRAGTQRLHWNKTDRLSLGTKLVELVCEATGLFQTYRRTVARHRTEWILSPTDVCLRWLEEQHARCELLAPLYMPMLVKPVPWRTPYRGGYLSAAIRLQMVKTSNRQYMDELGSVDMPRVYKALNAVQDTAWTINNSVLDVMRAVWDDGGALGGLPPRDDKPLPYLSDAMAADPASLKKWKTRAARIHGENATMRSQRIGMSQKLWIAERFADADEIYFPYQMDFRGRIYPVVPFVTPQADDSGKALLKFAKGKALGEYGPFWLAVHLANLYGIDKVDFESRVAWVFDHEQEILDSAFNPLDGARFWAYADGGGAKAYQFLAACFEWAGYCIEGADYVSHLPIALDGSCSGLQHYSAALRDEVGGKAVNLVPSETPNDVYTEVAEAAERIIESSMDVKDKADGKDDSPKVCDLARAWRGKVVRKIAKRPTMTYCYAATRYGMQRMILDDLQAMDASNAAQGKAPHLEGFDNYRASKWMSHVIYQAIGDTVHSAQRAMEWLKALARLTADGGLPVYWVTPAGFPVLQEYKHKRGRVYNVFYAGARVQLFLRKEGKALNKKAQASAIAPNWVHSLDAAHLMSTVNACMENGIESLCLVHDSFGTHAADTDALGSLLRSTFVEQYEGRPLEELEETLRLQLSEELVAKMPEAPPTGSLDLTSILRSQFCFA